MNIPIQHILAKSEGWEQIIVPLIIFAIVIIKKIFSTIKDYAAAQSEQFEEQEKPAHPQSHPQYSYSKDAHKTVEQMRDENRAKIRKRYGIPEPGRAKPPVRHEGEPEPLEEQPIREHLFDAPPPLRIEKPAYVPPVYQPKKPTQVRQQEETTPPHPAYAQPQTVTHSVGPAKKAKQTSQKNESNDDTLIRLTRREDLRAAILYQEILGKPIALRE